VWELARGIDRKKKAIEALEKKDKFVKIAATAPG
jgi:hypothetical protein